MTLHEPYGKRIVGYDNAHAVKPPKKFKYAGRILAYDHKHRHVSDKGVPYEFKDAQQLINDFFCRRGSRSAGGEEAMKAIVIGIMPQEKIRERVLAIARGDYKPKPSEPKVWFTSMKSLAEVLSDDNRALLKVITETKPESISALAEATGRKPGNLSRTLKTMSNYGIVDLKREKNHVRPVAKATEFRIVAA